MSRFREAAMILAVATLIVPAGMAEAQTPRLSPTPPVPLRGHASPSPHRRRPPSRPKPPPAPAPKPLPKTGLDVLPELLAAASLLTLGAWGRRTLGRRNS